MIETLGDLARVLDLVFPATPPPKPLNLVRPLTRVRSGELMVSEAAKQARTTPRRISELAGAENPLYALMGGQPPVHPPALEPRVRAILGQLIIGNIAERVFEELYKTMVGTSDLQLRDDRSTRGDTDYLVLNGQQRQVFRINIKFHGALFRRAKDLVGLDPEDCFALATYKIHAALLKQDAEHLPYIFVIVGVAGLAGEIVGADVPDELVRLATMAHAVPSWTGVRAIEDQIVDRLVTEPAAFDFQEVVGRYLNEIRTAGWFVLSARRAYNLLRDNLFERAYALRVPRFAQNYRGAELDMHLSLSRDLTPLPEFLTVLRDSGMPGLVSRLERGTL